MTGSPCKLKLIPEFDPPLQEHITVVSWDCVNKTVKIIICETPTFSAFAWLGTINDRHAASQQNAFSDQDSITLIFVDLNEKEVAKLKLKGVRLKEHNASINVTLQHMMTIGYDKVVEK